MLFRSLPSGWKAVSKTFNNAELKPQINGTSYTWELRNLAPIPPEPMSPSIRNLAPRVNVNYSPDDSEIRLQAARTDGSCVIEVIDSGPGLPAGDLTRVFERFYRVDKSRSRPGTGLGLAIVKHLVELHGGTVAAANRPNGGAVFTVTLPVVASA